MKTRNRARTGRRERGAELFELAVILPFLLVLVAGVADFAQGWNLRQVLANAARDGARLGSNQQYLDLTTTNPASIQQICQQVADYLIAEHVNPAFMGITGTSASAVQTGCSAPGTVGGSSSLAPSAYTYYESGSTTYGLTIEPEYQVPPPGSTCGPSVNCIQSTRVTLTYPFNWTMGSNFFGLAKANPTIPIQVNSIMADLANL